MTMIHTYRLNGFNIVVDAASGAVHSVDDVAFDIIERCDIVMSDSDLSAKEFFADKEILDAIVADIVSSSGISREDVRETLDDLAELSDAGQLWSEDPFEAAADEIKLKQSVLKAICLHVAHGCNMDCEYCFAGKGDYSGKSGIMSAALAAVAFTNAARIRLIARNVMKIIPEFFPNLRMSQRETRFARSVDTMALAMMKAETFSQITGSPRVAIAGFALSVPVRTRPQMRSIEVT